MAKPLLADRTLPRLLSLRAERDADGILLTDEQGSLTSGAAWTASARVAGGFHRMGIRSGDRVAVMLENSREFLLTWFGLASLGAVEVPVNPQALGPQLVYVLRHSGARALVVDAALLDRVAPALSETGVESVIVVGTADTPLDRPVVDFREVQAATPHFDGARSVAPGDTVAIMYTSGSTGRPKGVVLPHGQHVENGWQATTVARMRPDDRTFVCLPLHHNMAQGYGVWPALVSGGSFALSRRFSRATFWDEVRTSGSTVWAFVGAMLVLLAKDLLTDGTAPAPNPLRVAYGVPIPQDVHRRFEGGFGLRLIPCYGSTEATIVAWGTLERDEPFGSCGAVFPDFDVQIQAPDGAPVPAGEVGEICVRPREPFIMCQGYHDEPERGRVALRNLWFHSGDRGVVDGNGWFWFAGRAEDVVRRFGEFIAASEVEDTVLGCPAVDVAAVFAVPDEVAGEEVMVAVVPRPGVPLTGAEVRSWCETRLPAFSVPRYVDIVDELPMTATGKVEKFVLRRRGVSGETFDARTSTRRGA